MKIFVLVAGTNEPSNCNVLADAFIEGMKKYDGVEVQKSRLKDLRIEHFELDFYEPHCTQEEDFCMLQEHIQSSCGLVIATPVWNFSVPAHLKNFLDRMGSFALDEGRSRGVLGGLPFYLIFTGGAPTTAWKAVIQWTTGHVHNALEYFGGSYMGLHYEPRCTTGRGQFGLVVDKRPDSIDFMRKQGFEFVKKVATFERTGKAPLWFRVHDKFMRWAENLLKKIG